MLVADEDADARSRLLTRAVRNPRADAWGALYDLVHVLTRCVIGVTLTLGRSNPLALGVRLFRDSDGTGFAFLGSVVDV